MTCPYSIPPDYKSIAPVANRPGRLKQIGWFLFGCTLSFTGLLYAIQPDRKPDAPLDASAQPAATPEAKAPAENTPPSSLRTATVAPVSLKSGEGRDQIQEPSAAHTESSTAPVVSSIQAKWHEEEVRQGDSLARIFKRAGLSAQALHALLTQADREHKRALRRIYPGQRFRFRIEEDGSLTALEFEQDRLSTLRVECASRDRCRFEHQVRKPEAVLRHASATIHSSLFQAAQKAGLSDTLTMELAGIFGWDIDFALDIRAGDRFTVLYEELRLDGEKIGNGNILAAEFVNRGKVYQAVRYTDPKGRTDYYSPDGKSMRKAFLRTPVAFTRISSRFSLGRKHPILNRIRAHKGVDYAAPYGTPVKATGDGKVVFAGWKGGYGRVVILQHGSRYSTLYAHLSRYARGIRNGRRVRQGQVIGYVGKSGLATGPHLHYEFRINGVHRNPLTVKLPEAAPINRRYRADFQKQAQVLLAKLDRIRAETTQVAMRP